jgi:hypothetical protein
VNRPNETETEFARQMAWCVWVSLDNDVFDVGIRRKDHARFVNWLVGLALSIHRSRNP